MTDQNAQEPTMEEILSSIRRIISEDDQPAETAEAPAAPIEVAAEPPAPEPQVMAAAVEEVEVAVEPGPAEDVLELTEAYTPASESIGDLDVTRPEPEPFPTLAPEPAPAPVARSADVSSVVVAAVGGGVTVEALVRSIVEPQVKAWLEQNLDGLLRDMLRERLERVFR